MLYNFYKLFVESSLLEDLYEEGLLSPLTFTALGFAVAVAVIFYYAINKVSFSGLGNWLLMLLISALCMFIATLVTCTQKADQEILRVDTDPDQGTFFDQGTGIFLGFSVEMALLTALLFFIISMLIKGGSRNAKHRPMLWPSK